MAARGRPIESQVETIGAIAAGMVVGLLLASPSAVRPGNDLLDSIEEEPCSM